ncbi:MAG: hypothetical protein LBJ48_01870 [Coriobacteriales bacterium]|jgi:sporulation protein YlmC with PRC-barrel domain|nr:hypothetical protein [Coriobacteriales bacterium]
METNETILTRDIVVIDSQKKLGSVKALRIDCDTLAVSHYIVNSASTGSDLVLPFDKAIGVGDTFVTVQNRDDFLPTNNNESNMVLQEGDMILSEDVFTRTGNSLGQVKRFEFDTVHGTVTRLDLDDGTSFASDSFVFFSPEFIFVDDGSPTAGELRADAQPVEQASSVPTPQSVDIAVVESPQASTEEEAEPVDEAAETDETASEKEEVALEEDDEEASLSDEEIIDFLIGAELTADIETEDGEFKVLRGTILTQELIEEAAEHNALLLLTINVDV